MRRFVTTAVIALAGLAPGAVAHAGWVTIKNDTDLPVVYRECKTGPLGLVSYTKNTRLLPGESHKEWQAKPGAKTIEIHDLKPGNDLVFKGPLKWGEGNTDYTVTRTPDRAKNTETWVLAEVKPPPPPGAPVVQAVGGAAPAPVAPAAPATPVSTPKPPEKP